VEENKEPTTSKEEDVEAHGYVERPVGEQPSVEANTEEPDVEGHGFVEKPVAEKPVAE
jgi:predicted carbohydrate-binding protein with CBM5 and CBM33 domain